MTEEDTFRKLKKAEFHVVNAAADKLWEEVKPSESDYYRLRDPLLKEYGWTPEEWENNFRILRK